MRIKMKTSAGDMKEVKIGFSWTLFLFSGFAGITFFLRGVHNWGAIMLGYFVLRLLIILAEPVLFPIVLIIDIVVLLCIGFKGNELTAKYYLNNGGSFAEGNKDALKYAKLQWRVTE